MKSNLLYGMQFCKSEHNILKTSSHLHKCGYNRKLQEIINLKGNKQYSIIGGGWAEQREEKWHLQAMFCDILILQYF